MRIPEFALDGSSIPRLRDQADRLLAAGRGQFAPAWVSDHLVRWFTRIAVETDNL